MILINSGTYVGQELQNEFGKIPPVFLPLQNRLLLEHQIKIFEDCYEVIYLSLPDDYELSIIGSNVIQKYGIKVLRVKASYSLGQSIVNSLLLTGEYGKSLKMLHGDTLFMGVNMQKEDSISVAKPKDNYHWSYIDYKGQNYVHSGYFSFSNIKHIIQCIAKSDYDFIEAITMYGETYGFKLIEPNLWLDFGHLSTYYNSKSKLTTERSFNNLEITKHRVTKRSRKKTKIKAEANWYDVLPFELKTYAPMFLGLKEGGDESSYAIEYLYLTTLNELFVFGENPLFVWKQIFNSCSNFLSGCRKYKVKGDKLERMVYPKTMARLENFYEMNAYDLSQEWTLDGETFSLFAIAKETASLIDFENTNNCIVHGDFCFSNILYDFRKKDIKVIDPRGIDVDESITIYGNQTYDIAKLSHSINGMYDYIIAGYYDLKKRNDFSYTFTLPQTDYILKIQQEFNSLDFGGISPSSISVKAIVIHLFLSMLPLHFDNKERQIALLMNGIRLYKELKQEI